MSAAEGSPNKLDEVRRRLAQEANTIASAEAEQIARETAPPPRSKVWRYRQPILIGISILVVLGSAVAVFFVYRFYNPPLRYGGGQIGASRGEVAPLVSDELKRRGIQQPSTERDTRTLDELRRRPLVNGEENLDDVPAGAGSRLGEP